MIDARTPQSRKSLLLSYAVSSCEFGIAQFGDDLPAEDRLARLERDMLAAFGEAIRGQTIEVLKYDIHYGGATWYGATPMIAASTYSGGALTTTYQAPSTPPDADSPVVFEPRCTREKMSAGWFDRGDLERNMQPVVVDIEVRLSGKTVSSNSAYAPVAPLDPIKSPFSTASLQRAMAKANARLIESAKSQGWPARPHP